MPVSTFFCMAGRWRPSPVIRMASILLSRARRVRLARVRVICNRQMPYWRGFCFHLYPGARNNTVFELFRLDRFLSSSDVELRNPLVSGELPIDILLAWRRVRGAAVRMIQISTSLGGNVEGREHHLRYFTRPRLTTALAHCRLGTYRE